LREAEVKDTACIVLDTNALLVPYGIGTQTLSEIEATYQRLLKENRLAIPAQVAREFARNRVGKLTELYQRLSRRRSQLQPFQQGGYPLLENLREYRRLREVEGHLDHLITEYRQLLTSVIDHVQSWEWNDPVSLIYGKLFPRDVVVDTTKPFEEIRQEHRRRFVNKIPPGYKDEAKDDQGIGDLLLWLTILEIGSVRRTSVIFVSGERKPDWWHCSEQQQLYPRFELVDEFRRVSGGCPFHIIKFSRLLELSGASTEVVAEVQEEERIAAPQVPLTTREHEILQLIAEGQTTKEIAWRLGLSAKTIESHLIHLMRKLDIGERATLVRYARRRGANLRNGPPFP
jgi:DNA-binding CsgD family transcriptional regulator